LPLFIDIHHRIEGLTADAAADAHQRDLEVQARYGVRFVRYWYDEKTGKVFCLSEAPNAEAVAEVPAEPEAEAPAEPEAEPSEPESPGEDKPPKE
jgi:hypothetical protein